MLFLACLAGWGLLLTNGSWFPCTGGRFLLRLLLRVGRWRSLLRGNASAPHVAIAEVTTAQQLSDMLQIRTA